MTPLRAACSTMNRVPPVRVLAKARRAVSALAESAVRESKSFTDKEALDEHLIDLIATSDQALVAALDGRTVARFDGATQTLHTAGMEVEVYEKTARQKIVAATSAASCRRARSAR